MFPLAKQKGTRKGAFLFGWDPDFRWKSAACGWDVRFALMWQGANGNTTELGK